MTELLFDNVDIQRAPMNIENLLPVLIAFFIVTVSPGPANIAVATVSMSSGRHSGLSFGLGLSVGLACWGLVAATGLGVILQASESALLVLKLFGGIYLLWLAYQSTISSISPSVNLTKSQKEGRWFMRGLFLNLSNPKAVVAWMAALSTGLGVGDSVTQVAIATCTCILIGIANYTGHAVVFSFSGAMSGYQRFRRWIDGVVAGMFAIAGFGLIKSALSR